MENRQVIVVGAGASGLLAAGIASQRGYQVTLLEKNSAVGRKLLISGKGRCNLTNDCDIPALEKQITSNYKFLRPALYAFPPSAVMVFFTKAGVTLKTERGGRVFPVSDNAEEVLQALIAFCHQNGVTMRTNAAVDAILTDQGSISGVSLLSGEDIHAEKVLLACGGSSFPGTGSNGDGYRLAAALGHTIIPPRPGLTSLETLEKWPGDAQGLSLRNVRLTAYNAQGKKVFQEQGEMLFTHYGVSGPLVIRASRLLLDHPKSTLAIDLKPALSEEELDARIIRDFQQFHRREFNNALGELLPRSLIPVVVALSAIPGTSFVHNITREERRRLVKLLKALPLTVSGIRGFHEAIITVGGVSVREIDPNSMQSKSIPGLYFSGEIIDVDAFTGGYNLQIAWSTGYLAAMKM